MLKKEFREIYKYSLLVCLNLLIIPILAIFSVPLTKINDMLFTNLGLIRSSSQNSYLMIWLLSLAVVCTILSLNLGLYAFKKEFKDNSFEYLYSFPISRGRILFYKIFPRFIIVFALVILYEVMAFSLYFLPGNIMSSKFFLINPCFFPLWIIFFFLSGFFLSIFEQKNWMALVTLLMFYSIFALPYSINKILKFADSPITESGNFIAYCVSLGFFIILLILGLAFFIVYRRFDLRNNEKHARKFVFIVLPQFLCIIVVTIWAFIFA